MEIKPIIKVGFTDYFKGLDDFFISWLSAKYEVVRDDSEPDFLFFCDETFGTHNKMFNNKPVVKIFFTGENRRAWNYPSDAAITFDHYDTKNHYRLPLYVLDHWVMVNKLGMESIDSRDQAKRDGNMPDKTEFCCFISGNPGNEHRNKFFHLLSEYKKVDSYGPLFNNMGSVLPRGDDAAKNKDGVMQKYKFNLCFENGDYPGYCTEKLMHALYSFTIPIYSGSTTAAVDFNPDAFLSWHDGLSDNVLMDHIIRLDQNDDLYKNMWNKTIWTRDIFQPISTNAARKYWDQERFVNWFINNIYPMRKL